MVVIDDQNENMTRDLEIDHEPRVNTSKVSLGVLTCFKCEGGNWHAVVKKSEIIEWISPCFR